MVLMLFIWLLEWPMSAFLQHGHTKHVYYLVFELILAHRLGNDQYTFPTLGNTFVMDDQILELLG
jgi:hypothetical protein